MELTNIKNNLPLSNWPCLHTNDIESAASHMQSTYRPNILKFPKKTSLEFQHNKAELHDIQLHTVSYGCKTQIISPPTENIFLLVIPLAGRCHLDKPDLSFTAQKNDIFILHPNDDLRFQLSEKFKQLTLQIPESIFKRHIANYHDHPLDKPLTFSPFYRANNNVGRSIITLLTAIVTELNTTALLSKNKNTALHLERAILSIILDEFENSYKATTDKTGKNCRPRHVKRAEEYIREHYQTTICLETLTKNLGVTQRSLQMGFKKYLDTTPTNYIRKLRLEKARHYLSDTKEVNISITEISASCGFNHLSNFAKYYKQLFGETPSQTMRHSK